MMKKPDFYIIDLDWLIVESSEVHGWGCVPFQKLVDLILFDTEENYIDCLEKYLIKSWFYNSVTFLNFRELVEFWIEKRIMIAKRIATYFDVYEFHGNFIFHFWFSNHHLVIKRVDKCYIPKGDHLLTGRL